MKKKYLKIKSVILFLVCMLFLITLNIVLKVFLDFSILLHLVMTSILFLSTVVIIFIHVKYLQSYKYKVDEQNLYIFSGYVCKKHACFPIRRIQHVEYYQYIVQKKFQLACVKIVTGGGIGLIKLLDVNEAVELTNLLSSTIHRRLDEE